MMEVGGKLVVLARQLTRSCDAHNYMTYLHRTHTHTYTYKHRHPTWRRKARTGCAAAAPPAAGSLHAQSRP
jgi:hypothetical protein